MKKLYAALASLLLSTLSFSQYTQNFDTLQNTGTGPFSIFHEGWGIYEIESGAGTQGEGKYTTGTGTSNTGNTYSFGANAVAERALGSIASNTLFPTYGVLFFNESDSTLTTLTITYTGEQYRYGGRTTGTQDSLKFEYSLTATGLAATGAGVWIAVPELNFKSPNITGTTSAVLDGNLPANRQTLSFTLTGLSIQSGQSLLLRWSDINIASNDDGLSIDDFILSTRMATGQLASGGTNTGGGGGGGGGTTDNNSTSTPIFQNKVAIDSAFIHLYGNLHGHSTHSDGRASTGQPKDDYEFARGALGMDFLGISEHNHSTAGLQIADYKNGSIQADTMNGKLNVAGQPFVALHGMEWGTISGGGHVLLYGFKDSLLNWEPGNYDVLVPKSDYVNLFEKVRANPEAVALLAHPGSSDYTGLTGGYKGVADSAVASVAIESGPAFSTSTNYNDFPSSLAYINYYRSLLKQGYRVGAHMDQDNHELTFGTANANRIVVLAKDRTREGILNAIRSMRVYASNDYNAQVSFTINNYILGSSILTNADLTGVITHSDADGEGISAVQVYGGRVRGSDATLIHSATANTSFTTGQAAGETWYYYVIITQADGNKIVTAPIWVTKTLFPLPVTLTDFTATPRGSAVHLGWQTASEINSDYFTVERSADLVSFVAIGKVPAKGTAASYTLTDATPARGMNHYRLKLVDKNGRTEYSRIVSVNLSKAYTLSISPNPSTGLVTLTTNRPAGERLPVEIIDMAGNRVYNKVHTSSPQITLDLSMLPSGFYLVKVGADLSQLVIRK